MSSGNADERFYGKIINKGEIKQGKVTIWMITKELLQDRSEIPLLTKELSTREVIINEIIHLVNVLNIEKLTGWENIPFDHIDAIEDGNNHSTVELSVLLELLNHKFTEMQYESLLEEFYLQY